MHAYRTHTCGQPRKADVGQTVRLSGWVNRRRDHGGLIFIDLRDHYGITQCVIEPEESDAPAQVGEFGAFAKIQLGARGTKLIVEPMDLRIILFADVAILRLDDFAKIRILHRLLRVADWWKRVRRREDGLAAQFANAGFVENRLGFDALFGFALSQRRFGQSPPLCDIWTKNLASRLHQAHPLLFTQPGQQRAIRRDRFEQFGRRFQPRGERAIFGKRFLRHSMKV